jgi:DNA-binding transcriptional LysR family regulator
MSGDVLIRQLEYLVALARERHFGRAAAACHASQPALSNAVRKLESQLGVTIVQRGHRFAGFTPEGQRVVGWAHRILAERDALRADLDRMRGGLNATARIGAIPTAVPATPLLTGPFYARHPLATVRVEVLPSREIVRRLAEFDLDAGLTYLDPTPPPGTRALELYRERYLLLTPVDGEFGERQSVGWAEAATLPLCALTPVMRNRRILDTAMAAHGARMHPVLETDTVAAIYAQVATLHSSAVIAHTWLHAFGVPPGMRAIPLAGEAPRPAVGLLVSDRQPAALVATALLDAVHDIDLAARLDSVVAPAEPENGGTHVTFEGAERG